MQTYLQLLYPGAWSVEQQMQDKAYPYPTALYDQSTHGHDADKFLTSRLKIGLSVANVINDISKIIPVISTTLPARFVPKVFLVIQTEARLRVAAIGNIATTLCSRGLVVNNDFGVAIAARGNLAMTLNSSGDVAAVARQSFSLTQNFNTPIVVSGTEINSTYTLNKFDGSLGILTSVSLALNGRIEAIIIIHNDEGAPTSANIKGTSNVTWLYVK